MIEYKAIGNFAKIISGFAFKSEWFGKGEDKVIRIGDLVNKNIDINHALAVNAEKYNVSHTYKIQKNDILMALSGATVGKIAIAKSQDVGAYINQRVAIIRANNDITANYLKYFFEGKFLNNLLKNAGGVAQPNLSPKQLLSMEIPLPPLSEQKRIAKILDKADDLRQKRQQSITKLDELLQATFVDMFGDPITNPKGWEAKPLKEFAIKIQSGNTPKGGKENYLNEGIMFFRSQNVWKNKIIYDDIAYIDETTHKNMLGSSLKHKDILMTKTGRINTENSSLGRTAIYLGEDDKANLNGHVYLIRLNDKVNPFFILSILTLPSYYEYIRSLCVGGIDKRQLNKEHIENFSIIFPPIELQNDFVKIKLSIEKQREACLAQYSYQENLFQALQQQAFHGTL